MKPDLLRAKLITNVSIWTVTVNQVLPKNFLRWFIIWNILDTVVFDNSYSYFKAKKLTYSVVMVETPLGEIEKGASKIEEKIFDQNDNDISHDIEKV